jgi:hypothetical protein
MDTGPVLDYFCIYFLCKTSYDWVRLHYVSVSAQRIKIVSTDRKIVLLSTLYFLGSSIMACSKVHLINHFHMSTFRALFMTVRQQKRCRTWISQCSHWATRCTSKESWLDCRQEKRFSSSPNCPDLLTGSPRLLLDWVPGVFFPA